VEYSVWKDGKQIGQTDLEFRADKRRRAGIFRPNDHGVAVLPGICAMLPALMSFGEMCRRRGIRTEDYSPTGKRFPFEDFVETPEGRAVAKAASHFVGVELRDACGETIRWDVLMISDVAEVRTLARKFAVEMPDEAPEIPGAMYIISVTLPRRFRLALNRPGPRDTPFAVN